MTDLERRLREALGRLPGPGARATRRAERAALARLTGATPRRRRGLMAAAAATLAVVGAGAALAATDRLEVRLGAPIEPSAAVDAPGRAEVRLPGDLRGLALVADGRLTLRTRSGLDIRGLAVSAAELSPSARFAAVGIGSALVALAPDGRRAWSHGAGGPVVAIAWAPNPIAVAYVVRRGPRHELWVIEGDGDGARRVDRSVRPVRPSWRADTLALAYVDADGAGRVAAYPSLASRVLPVPTPVRAVAFAPAGDRLAVAPAGSVAIVAGGRPVGVTAIGTPVTALGWEGEDLLLAVAGRGPERLLGLPAAAVGRRAKPRSVLAEDVAALAAGSVVAVRRRGEVRVARRDRTLVAVPAPAGAAVALSAR